MSDHHHHHHNHHSVSYKRLWLAFWINAAFLIVEVIGGLWTNSLALLSDAGHMLTDVAALALAIMVARLGQKQRDNRRSYGYKRAEIIGAFLNGATLVAICGFILFEAWKRIGVDHHVAGGPMLIIAVFGLLANVVSAYVLASEQHENINVRGAYLHLIFDALGSVGAIISGLVIWLWGWTFIDVIASVVIVVLILVGTIPLLKQSINMLLDAVPENINYQDVARELKLLKHVTDIHDLHIWSINPGQPGLSVHLILSDNCQSTDHWVDCLNKAQNMLKSKFQIEHATIQLEPPEFFSHNHCDSH